MISRLHYITNQLPGRSHQSMAEKACMQGVDWLQLRVKNKPFDEWLHIAREVKKICQKYDTKLIINDNVEIAKIVDADGVHLGKNDMRPSEARKILGNNIIIGGTANTFEDIKFLTEDGVDYIGLGPLRFTETKENLSTILGLDGYLSIMSKVKEEGINTPIVAIGGINDKDVPELLKTGIYGIAVSSFISNNLDKPCFVPNFNDLIDKAIINLEHSCN